uniref:Uncharacterized protein n=1 Tax=Colletotrichum fructicola (strain Nara gc5) TaxID=1213859 RepID=L2FSW9_COLFN
MTFILPRGPKMIEAICPGCFKSFTKIGSMHRVSTPSTQISQPALLMSMKHIYEDRCRNPVPRFVKKIKAEHNARVAAAAARSAARAAARAAPDAAAPPEQNTNTQVKIEGQEPTKHCLPSLDCGCGVTFSHKTDLDLHKNGGYCVAKQSQWQPQPQPFDLNYFDANWMAFDTTWGQSWPQAQPQLTNWTSTSPGCA